MGSLGGLAAELDAQAVASSAAVFLLCTALHCTAESAGSSCCRLYFSLLLSEAFSSVASLNNCGSDSA